MDRMTLTQFVNRYRIHIKSEPTDNNPNMTDMVRGSAHWRVTLKCGRKQMSLYYSQGPAIISEPEARDVLDCLASDCATFANARSFDDWCGEYGYDTDSRKAEKTYKTIERQYNTLEKLLPADAFNTLLWHTERLWRCGWQAGSIREQR